MAKRHSEIDALRGIAIYLMVLYHSAFDLQIFYNWNIDVHSTTWNTVRLVTVTLFLFVSGVSTNFSNKPLRRSCIVLACAGLISMVTYVYDPSTWIRFGILHCIGVGMLLLIVLQKLKEFNILLGIFIIYTLFTINYQLPTINSPTLDYYPLIPWFGIMLIGQGLGYYLYQRKQIALHVQPIRALTIPGTYALQIYLLHQPILLSILFIASLFY